MIPRADGAAGTNLPIDPGAGASLPVSDVREGLADFDTLAELGLPSEPAPVTACWHWDTYACGAVSWAGCGLTGRGRPDMTFSALG